MTPPGRRAAGGNSGRSGKPSRADKPAGSGKGSGEPIRSGKPAGSGKTSGKPGDKAGRQGGFGAKAGSGTAAGKGTKRSAPAGFGGPRRAVRVRTSPSQPPLDVHDPDGVRLQKVLAQAGLGSRRACEELITDGRVEVDGQVVTELGVRVDPRRAVIHVDGLRVQLDESLVTLALNKPVGVLSAMSDSQDRATLADLVTGREERLFHIGRLDVDSEGLILLTNDGELANRLAHPSYEVPKTYLVEIAVTGSTVPRDLGRRLLTGIELDDGPASVDSFRVVDARPGHALIELVLHDGRNRVIRRLMEAAGFPVLQLVRTQIGPIRLGDLRTGRHRVISGAELGTLMAAVGL
ncbi:MAG: pseudouridine synthase [Kineosporiaceae bacterium]